MTRTPSAPDETTDLGAAELARRIGAGALSSREVVGAYVRRAEEVNPRLNAVVVRRFEADERDARRDDYRARFLAALDARGFDAVLCPVEALPAHTHGASVYLSDALSHTALYNLLGMPAGVVAATRVRAGEESDRAAGLDLCERLARKIERGSAGLPVGVQVAARHWREDIVLAVMSALEEHFGTRPGYPIRSER